MTGCKVPKATQIQENKQVPQQFDEALAQDTTNSAEREVARLF
jgi:multidrug efflux system outer membrane protein